MSDKCKHGHITPPECLACVVEEREQLQQENQVLREELKEIKGDLHYENLNRLKASNFHLDVALMLNKQELTRLREALKQCEKDFSILLTRGDFADEDIPRVTRTRDAAREALAPQEGKQHGSPLNTDAQ